MKTSINIPTMLIEQIKAHNLENPEREINRSGVCRKALQKALDDQT